MKRGSENIDVDLLEAKNFYLYTGLCMIYLSNRAVKAEAFEKALLADPLFREIAKDAEDLENVLLDLDQLLQALVLCNWNEEKFLKKILKLKNIKNDEEDIDDFFHVTRDVWFLFFEYWIYPVWRESFLKRDFDGLYPRKGENIYDFSRRVWPRILKKTGEIIPQFRKGKKGYKLVFKFLDLLEASVPPEELLQNVRDSRTMGYVEQSHTVLYAVATVGLWAVMGLMLDQDEGRGEYAEPENIDKESYIRMVYTMLISFEIESSEDVSKLYEYGGCFQLALSSALCLRAVLFLVGYEAVDIIDAYHNARIDNHFYQLLCNIAKDMEDN